MKSENRYFDVWPKVVPADTCTTIHIKDRYNQSMLRDDKEYEVFYYPLDRKSTIGEFKYQEKKILRPENGVLNIEQFFKGEQEHIIKIIELNPDRTFWEEKAQPKKRLIHIRIYSLNKDLFERKPYKGDLHMHSYVSDGIESPEFVAASCRRIGFDFMAITDHKLYKPSIRAIEAFKDVKHDMLMCRGEEVHPIDNPVHMINFGGSYSINDLINNNKEKYLNEVNIIKQRLNEIEDEDTRYQCASCMWVFDKIRDAGGLGIFCHPYWMYDDLGYFISDTLISFMLKNQPYDAFELIGGYPREERESNNLQEARYQEERAKGRKIPIVGVSDSHGCENSDLFGWYYTIVFSKSLDQKNIIGSIKDLYSVAVEAIPGEGVRAYGPMRLVKYALFLIREIMPEHDELCCEEGHAMSEYISGRKRASEKLADASGQTAELLDKLWA